MIHVPDDVSRQPWPEALRAFVEQISSENSIEQHRALEIHTEAAISELRNVPEIQLLKLVAGTLGGNSTRLQILQSFYALCSNLLEASDVPIPSELRAALDMGEESADQQKRSCTQPTENDCRGMCGASSVTAGSRFVAIAVTIGAVMNATCAANMPDISASIVCRSLALSRAIRDLRFTQNASKVQDGHCRGENAVAIHLGKTIYYRLKHTKKWGLSCINKGKFNSQRDFK